MAVLEFASDSLRATVDTYGAQLTTLETGDGTQLLWPGNPDTWPDHAPILFPVIGPLEGGVLRHDGNEYPMPAHGFARSCEFAVVSQAADSAVLELRDSEESRRHYPFSFRFQVSFSLGFGSLTCDQTLENPSGDPLPADLGFHPGFRWPLDGSHGKQEHVIRFEQPEPGRIRRGQGDPIALLPEALPTPVEANILHLDDELFKSGPVVFDRPRSHSLLFGVPGATALQIDFPDSPNLALWMWPGEAFLAIEPWHGLPSPVGYTGPFSEKPGVALVPPGLNLRHRLVVSLTTMPSGTSI